MTFCRQRIFELVNRQSVPRVCFEVRQGQDEETGVCAVTKNWDILCVCVLKLEIILISLLSSAFVFHSIWPFFSSSSLLFSLNLFSSSLFLCLLSHSQQLIWLALVNRSWLSNQVPKCVLVVVGSGRRSLCRVMALQPFSSERCRKTTTAAVSALISNKQFG